MWDTETCLLSRDRTPVLQPTVSWGTCLHDIACFRDVEEAHVFRVEAYCLNKQPSRYESCSFRQTTWLQHRSKSLGCQRYNVPRQRVGYKSSASIFGGKFEFCFEPVITCHLYHVTAPNQSQKSPNPSSYSYSFLWRSLTIPCKQTGGYVQPAVTQPAVTYKPLRFTHRVYF